MMRQCASSLKRSSRLAANKSLNTQRKHYATDATAELQCYLHSYVRGVRAKGHLKAEIDPLGLNFKPQDHPALSLKRYALDKVDPNETVFNINGVLTMDKPKATLAEIQELLNKVYCSKIGAVFSHLENEREYNWLSKELELTSTALSNDQKLRIHKLISEAEGFDHFMTKKFPQTKRYGLEGAESMIPAMDHAFSLLSQSGVTDVVIGMPHRGRLNLLVNPIGYQARHIFNKAKGFPEIDADCHPLVGGDVLSHLAHSGDLTYGGNKLRVSLLQNPSHLEAINPVAMGKTKSRQLKGKNAACILIHGDAAFALQGIVPESLQLANLKNFSVKGTLHFILNNQVGFTTTAERGRSTRYSGEMLKMIDAPLFVVNADHPEEVVKVMDIAVRYREKFQKDVIIEMVGYRRWGHNELDEPRFTQPALYQAIASQQSVVSQYTNSLISQGVVTQEAAQGIKQATEEALEKEYQAVMSSSTGVSGGCEHLGDQWSSMVHLKQPPKSEPVSGVSEDILKQVAIQSVTLPEDITPHSRLQRYHIQSRKSLIENNEPVDWATAEAMAVGSLVMEGRTVRLCGQDVGRGTFSHRHFEITDQNNNNSWFPLQNMSNAKGKLEVVNSPLSELAVLGFEYGYSCDHPDNLCLWEAQFGDFNNGAQIIIDQFISSGEVKWLKQSGIVMLLPHGFDGAGPEHSSSRIERFLQLGDGSIDPKQGSQDVPNIHIINPTTPANYFHALRRQMVRNYRKPLIVISPKTLLRLNQAVSHISEMGPNTSFQTVIPDTSISNPANVKQVVLCSGKFYYDLVKHREAQKLNDQVAIIRIEELHPFPFTAVKAELSRYNNASRVAWCQEEHENMGAYTYVEPRLRNLLRELNLPTKEVAYAGRRAFGASAVGIGKVHAQETKQLMDSVFRA